MSLFDTLLAAPRHGSTLWLALEGRAPGTGSTLRQALRDHPALTVPLRHPQVDPQQQPLWYRLDPGNEADRTLLRLSLDTALQEAAPAAAAAGSGHEVAGWLMLPPAADPAAVAGRIGAHMIQQHEGHDMLLRLHDRAVLWWMWRLMNDAQHAALLAGAQAWCLINPAGELETLAAGPGDSAAPLDLTPQQWEQVRDIGALNQALRAEPAWATRRDGWRLMLQAAARARHHGLNSQDDIALFACHAMQVHSCFDHHPLLQDLLAIRLPDESYASLVAALDEPAWQRIQRDCLAMTHPQP